MKRVTLILVLVAMWSVGVPAMRPGSAFADDQQLINPVNPNAPQDNDGQQVVDNYSATDDGTDGDPGDAGDGYGRSSEPGWDVTHGYGASGLSWLDYLWLMLMQIQQELHP